MAVDIGDAALQGAGQTQGARRETARAYARAGIQALLKGNSASAERLARMAQAHDNDCPGLLVMRAIDRLTSNPTEAEAYARSAMRLCASQGDDEAEFCAMEILARALFHQVEFHDGESAASVECRAIIDRLLGHTTFAPISRYVLECGLMGLHAVAGHLDVAYRMFDDIRYRYGHSIPLPDTRAPIWDGSNPAGKVILVCDEETGLGDFVQCIRYARAIHEMGGRVIVEAKERLLALAATTDGVSRVLPKGDSAPHHDYRIGIMSLPLLCGISSPDDIWWRGPYLRADPAKVEAMRQRIVRAAPTGLCVGLSWAPLKDPKRLVPFQALARLFSIPGVHWFGLQRGPHADDARGTGMVDLEDAGGTIMDTAAAMVNLDLIISADTMTAHLAGALGRPVWTLLPERFDALIWTPGREDTPWYPSMRLFWQRTEGEWDAVVEQVRGKLTIPACAKASRFYKSGSCRIAPGGRKPGDA